MNRPLLNPPCTGWKEVLPAPECSPLLEASLGNQAPNFQDCVYLEVPRSAISPRGIVSALAIMLLIFYITQLPIIVSHTNFKDLSSIFATALELLLVSLGIAVFIRWDILPPRDLPIRFNRAHHKIYAYNFKHQWWNPFDKGKVVPVSYNWSQVRAERWSQTGVLPNGGVIFKWGVMLSIVAPGTNNVIDRFPLTTMGADQHAWAYICTYMQQGPSALPPPGEPKDHDDVLWCEFALRLAPRVVWPAEMDLESRTAP